MQFDNNIIAVIVYVFSNCVLSLYLYFTKRFNIAKFQQMQEMQQNILEIVSTPSSARTEIIVEQSPHQPYPSPNRVPVPNSRDIDLGGGRVLRIHN